MRIALYWAPAQSTLLGQTAADWLKGRDSKIPGVEKQEVLRLLSAPSHYGFHGTIKPPFRLKPGYILEDVEQELATFAAQKENTTFRLPYLEVARIGKFFCLKPISESPQLLRFATAALQRFDHFRAPAHESELARRRAPGLTQRQDQLLLEWGYPYVMEEFQFHLTLTGNVQSPSHFQPLEQELLKRFNPALQRPCIFNSLSMFIQHDTQPFIEYKRWRLRVPTSAQHIR